MIPNENENVNFSGSNKSFEDTKAYVSYLEGKIAFLSLKSNEETTTKALLESIPDMFFLMNTNGDYVDYRGGKRTLFMDSKTIVGKNIRDSGMKIETIELIMNQIRTTIDTGQTTQFDYSIVFENGLEHWYESRTAAFDHLHVIRILREITDKVLLEKHNAALLLKLKKAFFNISHQLRKPLANALGLLSLIMSDRDSGMQIDERYFDTLKKSMEELDAQLHISNSFLVDIQADYKQKT